MPKSSSAQGSALLISIKITDSPPKLGAILSRVAPFFYGAISLDLLKKSPPQSFSMKPFSGRFHRNFLQATAGPALQVSATPQKIWRRLHAETVQKSTKLPDPKISPHQKPKPPQHPVNPYTLPLR